MQINITQLEIKISPINNPSKHQNLLAHVILKFKENSGDGFIISGFTLWKSKYGYGYHGYHVEPPTRLPSRGGYKFRYFSCDSFLWRKIEREIINQYECGDIPIYDS
jgi:hypothetical protein